jgi:hypothetical protein
VSSPTSTRCCCPRSPARRPSKPAATAAVSSKQALPHKKNQNNWCYLTPPLLEHSRRRCCPRLPGHCCHRLLERERHGQGEGLPLCCQREGKDAAAAGCARKCSLLPASPRPAAASSLPLSVRVLLSSLIFYRCMLLAGAARQRHCLQSSSLSDGVSALWWVLAESSACRRRPTLRQPQNRPRPLRRRPPRHQNEGWHW